MVLPWQITVKVERPEQGHQRSKTVPEQLLRRSFQGRISVPTLAGAGLAGPGLGAGLDGGPGGAERRGVGQVEVADLIDGHAVEDRGGGDVDALGDFGVLVPEQLDAEEPAGGAVAGEAHVDAVAAG